MGTFILFVLIAAYFGYNFFSLKKALDENSFLSNKEMFLRFFGGVFVDLIKLIKK